MKKLIILTVFTIVVLFLWISFKTKDFSRDEYLSQEVLEKSAPIDVKIDLDLINELVPAYERE